ncbi:MAG: Rrf2 family transcriptional regulator [Bacteroidetes bacterium]|nr:Rrf2 family transcriptional regulator [Bacteroidota bacterium]
MLSLTCKASIKAVIFLASKHDSAQKSGIKEIAEVINENEHTVGKLLQKLVKDKIIKSSKGPNGGFFISEKQMQQRIIKIVESIDGKSVFKKCGLSIEKCNDKRPCALHYEYKPVRELFQKMCTQNRVIDLYQNVRSGKAHLS